MIKLWLDAQLPPQLASWLRSHQAVDAVAVRDLGLLTASDEHIFWQARTAGAVLISKDADFLEMVRRHGPPPKLIWLTCGNVSNALLRERLACHLAEALAILSHEDIVEIA